jgi:hypothetical protein
MQSTVGVAHCLSDIHHAQNAPKNFANEQKGSTRCTYINAIDFYIRISVVPWMCSINGIQSHCIFTIFAGRSSLWDCNLNAVRENKSHRRLYRRDREWECAVVNQWDSVCVCCECNFFSSQYKVFCSSGTSCLILVVSSNNINVFNNVLYN